MSRSVPTAVPDTQLGLSSEEVILLRQSQAALAAPSTAPSSSRNASRASSSQAGLLMLDSSSLSALGRHFDHLMAGLEAHISRLATQANQFTTAQFDAAGELVAGADAEIERYTLILGELDELETEFDRIAHIRQIVREYRARVEALDWELERSTPSSRHGGSGGASSSSSSKKHASSSSSHKHKHKK